MSRRILVLACVVVMVMLAGCAPQPTLIDAPPAAVVADGLDRGVPLTYRVTGNAARVWVGYLDTWGHAREEWVTLPWERTELFAFGAPTWVRATKATFATTGTVTCELIIGDTALRSDTAGFGRAAATCGVKLAVE